MRLVVAPDKFAGSLSARQAAAAIAGGWRRVRPADEVDQVPLADGGPGFLDVLAAALGGERVAGEVEGPLGDSTPASVLLVEQGGVRTAYVEAAQACGLALVGDPSPRTAVDATSAGVADLLRLALEHQPLRVVVGVGGTATSDGGRACVERLGATTAWPDHVELVAATDVAVPLLGPGGAVATFGPQKGADLEARSVLEAALEDWVRVTQGPADRPGAGAGGGLGYALLLLGGRIEPGVGTVMDAVGLPGRLVGADLAVTGEGRLDRSSLFGKVPGGVAGGARQAGVRCVVLAGDRAGDLPPRAQLAIAGIDDVRTLVAAYGRDAALADAAARLADLAAELAAEHG